MSARPPQAAAPGTLYVLATPIGNLGDLSPRAAELLRTVSAVAAEDTRRTHKLFAHLGAAAPLLLSLPAFDERGRLEPVLARLRAGQSVALCTDAGTPGVSDPGAALVAAAWEAGVPVVPVPGPSAAVTALAASGFPADRFVFAGFLPRKGGARAAALGWLAASPATLVLYEAGNRTAETLRDLAAALGDRPALVARELTKLHEELARGPLGALADRFAGEVKGEVTLVVAPPAPGAGPAAAPEAEPLEDELRRRLAAGEPPSAVAREVARARGLVRSDVYAALERLKHGGQG
ncbi:Uroporphyrin-III C/tetrapyrrole (Corrin/Porphyrin) methyltransferase [Anaeromyxobacter dehalogenans 2CP-1]|uniref:Ribosomal RNA small subunit methyltransferase I n=1 Tax=Anaeromyxobacter dehalogenans (strain ATCC BAA-258 / DSM 21875 / 2CP-1) TaxID=455488 RepID=B8J897_ANAD2|nr:16S rRNA (cytidine(1402)-2'-O)-methyltransferase [Anaeromyxobacter dehalogenans]ACL65396.1 Uroporphyrin-III C/tetrapyrrole (Corrin/Porphyrin) methyltransferase [Anaeromyxobacter dehalogenans 2CP-1]